jgi:hypothetical protein
LTHSVTEHTSNLMYLYQSGAINESMSDVMGELADQWNGLATDTEADRWLLGEDLPATVGVVRNMKDPTKLPSGVPSNDFTPQPAKMTSPLYFGTQVNDLDTGQALPLDNGGVHINSGVGNKAAYLIVDGSAPTFNGVTVPGLGGRDAQTRVAAITKAAQIYFKADESLTSGADYADLARVLPAACDSLVGGTAGITTSDCATVRAAVQATEMTKQPQVAAAPEAPVCASGFPMSSVWYDDLENPASGRWVRNTRPGPWYYPASDNIYDTPIVYATSGTQQMFGDDVDQVMLQQAGVDAPRQGSIAMTRAITVPVGVPAYLRFNQAYVFEWYRSFVDHGKTIPALYADGGQVQYTVDNGKHWLSAGPLFDANGYNVTVRGYDASQTRQLYSFRGFGGDSHGYISSRLDLTSLAGKAVRFRFRVVNDATIGDYGWQIDDVRFYACSARPSAPTSVTAQPGVGQLTVGWRAPSAHGTSAIRGYTVTVKSGSTIVGAATFLDPAARSGVVTGLPGGKDLTAYVTALNATSAGPAGRSSTLLGSGLRIATSATSIAHGAHVAITGRLVKAGTTTGLGDRRVGLYRADVGSTRWTWVTSVRTGRLGYYAFDRAPSVDTQYETRFLGGSAYQGVASATRQVDVR